jgi:hypothetical protein
VVDFPCLFQRFDPAIPLAADDPAYVDWQSEIGLTDVKQQLANSVLLTTHGYSHRLVTGLRGGGKTTELRRLRRTLETRPEGQRYFVSFLDADDTLDLDDANPTDLVLAVVRQLITDLRAAQLPVTPGKKLKRFLAAARDILQGIPDAGVDVEVGDPTGIVKLSTTLKRQPSARRELRELIEGSLVTLYDAINDELLPTVRERLTGLGYAGMLIIVDQLDRIPPEDDRHRLVFLEGRGKLKALDCHVLYTAPIEYAFSRACPTLEHEYGEILGLPLIPVTASDETVRRSAIELTKRIALERITGCGTSQLELFEDPTTLDELVGLSGGHLRTLFLLVRTAIERSGLEAPLTASHMQRVISGLAAKYLDPLEGAERTVALHVHETKARPDDDAMLDRFYDLLRDQYVFTYWAGEERWYDWNPLLGRSKLGRGVT